MKNPYLGKKNDNLEISKLEPNKINGFPEIKNYMDNWINLSISRHKKIVSTINDTDSMICTTNERDFMKSMGGGCNYPIGAYSNIVENKIFLEGIVLSLDGKKSIRYEVESFNREENLAPKLSKKFFDNDVSSLLNEIDNEIK